MKTQIIHHKIFWTVFVIAMFVSMINSTIVHSESVGLYTTCLLLANSGVFLILRWYAKRAEKRRMMKAIGVIIKMKREFEAMKKEGGK